MSSNRYEIFCSSARKLRKYCILYVYYYWSVWNAIYNTVSKLFTWSNICIVYTFFSPNPAPLLQKFPIKHVFFFFFTLKFTEYSQEHEQEKKIVYPWLLYACSVWVKHLPLPMGATQTCGKLQGPGKNYKIPFAYLVLHLIFICLVFHVVEWNP